MANLLAVVSLLTSIAGLLIMAIKKAPVLAQIPIQKNAANVFGKLSKNKLSSGVVLQTVLSKSRILTLRTDRILGNWLSSIRQKSLENRKKLTEDYWKKIRIRRKKITPR